MSSGAVHSSTKMVSQEVCKQTVAFMSQPITGHVLRNDLLGTKKLADTVTELAGDEREEFLDLASGMLQWLPEKRKTAKELLQHPIFDSLNKRRAQWRMDG